MAETLEVLNTFSMPLKAAWIVWLALGMCLMLWHRRAHIDVVRALPVGRPRPARKIAPDATEPPVTAAEPPETP